MLGNFACARYRFVLQAITPLRLNAFAGSTLRGGFGHVFKRTVCIWPPGDCPRCLLKNTCSYPYIFETAPPPGSEKLRNIDQIPRPFVIEPPQPTPSPLGGEGRGEGHSLPGSSLNPHPASFWFRPGDLFDFGLVLVGRAIDYLPYFLFTFIELGRIGLGPDRGRYTVAEVHAEPSAPLALPGRGAGGERGSPLAPPGRGDGGEGLVYSARDGVLHDHSTRITAADRCLPRPSGERAGVRGLTLHFLTPTRIKSDGAVQTELSFQDLIRALLRRLSSLCYFHCGCELELDFKGLIEQASAVQTVDSQLRWHAQERVSGRQHQRIDMGGIVGTVTFEANQPNDFTPFLPLLAAGEWVHVGKGAVMGLGKYEMETI